MQPDAVYAGAAGQLFCIDPSTGIIRWQNRLPSLGTGIIAFAEATSMIVVAGAAAAAAAAAAAGGA